MDCHNASGFALQWNIGFTARSLIKLCEQLAKIQSVGYLPHLIFSI